MPVRIEALLAVVFCASISCAADFLPQGKLTGHLVPLKWEPGYWGGWHRMDGLYEVPAGETLFVEPGTKIAIASGTVLTVRGTLLAGRESNASIEFREISGSSDKQNAHFLFQNATGYSLFENCHWNGFPSSLNFSEQSAPAIQQITEVIRVEHSGLRIKNCSFRNCGPILRADSSSWVVANAVSIAFCKVDPRQEHLVDLLSVRSGSRATFGALAVYNSTGRVVVDCADSVKFGGCTLFDNTQLRLRVAGHTYVLLDHVVLERNRVFDEPLVQVDRDAHCVFENAKVFGNIGTKNGGVFVFRPGSQVDVRSATICGNLIESGNDYSDGPFATLTNYGRLTCTKSIFSHGAPNSVLLTGQPFIEPDVYFHEDGIGYSRDSFVSSGDAILSQDTASATFRSCCFYGYGALFVEKDMSLNFSDEPRLVVHDVDTSGCLRVDPVYSNVATGDLRLSRASPLSQSESSNVPIGCDFRMAKRIEIQR